LLQQDWTTHVELTVERSETKAKKSAFNKCLDRNSLLARVLKQDWTALLDYWQRWATAT